MLQLVCLFLNDNLVIFGFSEALTVDDFAGRVII